MKKLASLLLILVMLTTICAYASEGAVGVAMQPQNGLQIIYMEERYALTDEPLRERMQWAYDTIHATGHFSEMSSATQESSIYTDINRTLGDMGLNLTAYDYMIYESFELKPDAQYAAEMENGGLAEVCFDLQLDRTVHPVVLLSNDSKSWKCIESTNVACDADGKMTVRFNEPGTVLVLIEVESGVSAANEQNVGFTPSVSGKAAPDVLPPKGAAANIVARIYNEMDEMIIEVPDEGYLIVTPVSRRDAAEDKEVRERLNWAYNQIKTTPHIGDLPAEGMTTCAESIDRILDNSGFDLTSEDLVVRDLFDASLYGTAYVDSLNDDGHYIEITFDMAVRPNDPLVFLVSNDNKTWKALDSDAYKVNADGSVTVYLEEMGTIAVLVDSEMQSNGSGESVKSPKTGE